MPDLHSELPRDLVRSPDETLILTQIKETRDSLADELTLTPDARTSRHTINAYLMKANELPILNQRLTLRSGIEWGLLSILGGIPLSSKSETLTAICILAHDGRVIEISPDGTDKTQTGRIDVATRDGAVQALRSGGIEPFALSAGPCRIRGDIPWKPELRSRVSAYIARIVVPEQESRESTVFGSEALRQ